MQTKDRVYLLFADVNFARNFASVLTLRIVHVSAGRRTKLNAVVTTVL